MSERAMPRPHLKDKCNRLSPVRGTINLAATGEVRNGRHLDTSFLLDFSDQRVQDKFAGFYQTARKNPIGLGSGRCLLLNQQQAVLLPEDRQGQMINRNAVRCMTHMVSVVQ